MTETDEIERFWSLVIGVWFLFENWCLEIEIYSLFFLALGWVSS